MDTTATSEHTASRRRIPPVAYGLLVIAIFAGVIGIGMATGTFQTSGRTTAGGERVAPQGESVAEIKGWMAVGDVADAVERATPRDPRRLRPPGGYRAIDGPQGPGE